MGMYTEIFFRSEVTEEGYGLIRLAADGIPSGDRRRHPFFRSGNWKAVFHGSSAYFPAARYFSTEIEKWGECLDFSVSFRADLKNYDNEVAKFFDWVQPYLVGLKGQFIGYELYEESDTPILYHQKENRIEG